MNIIKRRGRRRIWLRSFGDVLDAYPQGYALLGRAIGVPKHTVAAWRRRDSIPPAHWERLVRVAQESSVDGITLELLARLAAAHAAR